MGEQQARRIVVGVDGSAPSRAALAWAAGQAELTGSELEAVMAWHYPAVVGGTPFAPLGILEDTDFAALAGQSLQAVVGAVIDPASPVQVSATVRQGDAAQVLLEAARGPACWSWAAAGTAASPRRCSDQSASTACITPAARS